MNEITEGSVERFIKEAQSRKLVNFQVVDFFFRYFDIDSLNELTQKELNLANKKLAQHRLPTVDGSSVPLHSTQTEQDLHTRKIGN